MRNFIFTSSSHYPVQEQPARAQTWASRVKHPNNYARDHILLDIMHLSSASPRGGPRADVGEYGDFIGTLQQISALVVGEMWGL